MEVSDSISLKSTGPSSVESLHHMTADAVPAPHPRGLPRDHTLPAADLVGTTMSRSSAGPESSEEKEYINHVLQPMKLSRIMDDLLELKLFLETAPVHFSPHDVIHRFRLHTEEDISCIRWNNVFYMTGTDIVRCLTYRFAAFGRAITNRKKFEEGIFSDLRNLKCNEHAKLEGAKSEFLGFLYKHNCIRTKKKQKVFHWYSIRHDQLFIDALERDLKKESCAYRHTSDQSATKAVSEPALSFKYDHKQTLHDQMTGAITELPSPLAQIVNATMTSSNVLGMDQKADSPADTSRAAARLRGTNSANITVVQVAPHSGSLVDGTTDTQSSRVITLDTHQLPSMALPPGTGTAHGANYGLAQHDSEQMPAETLLKHEPYPTSYAEHGTKRSYEEIEGYGEGRVLPSKYSRPADPHTRVAAASNEDTPYKAILTLLSVGSNSMRNARSIIAAQHAVRTLTRYFPNFLPDLSGTSLGMILVKIKGLYLSEEELSYVENALSLVVSTREPSALGPSSRSAHNPYVVPMVPLIENDLWQQEPYGTAYDPEEEVHRYSHEAPGPAEYLPEYSYEASLPKKDPYDYVDHAPHPGYGSSLGYGNHPSARYRPHPAYSGGSGQYGYPYRQSGPIPYYEDYAAPEPELDTWGGRGWHVPPKSGLRPPPRRPQWPRQDDIWP